MAEKQQGTPYNTEKGQAASYGEHQPPSKSSRDISESPAEVRSPPPVHEQPGFTEDEYVALVCPETATGMNRGSMQNEAHTNSTNCAWTFIFGFVHTGRLGAYLRYPCRR